MQNKKNFFFFLAQSEYKKRHDIFSYNITSGMIIIDDIMSEIVLEISRVRRTREMSCFNFTNLISSMINHTTCYIR
jgi:hypothetical protein